MGWIGHSGVEDGGMKCVFCGWEDGMSGADVIVRDA
jgi:hypothetical protein